MAILTVFVLILVLVTSNAFSTVGTRVKLRSVARVNVGETLEMKRKGKRVSIQDRGEYMKRKRILDQRQQYEESQGDVEDGVPVFEIQARPKAGGLWIPAGNLKGDSRATALCNACMSGFMTDMYRGQLDSGVARSIMANKDGLANGLIQNYKPFSKLTSDDILFGFKVKYDGWEEKMGDKVTELVPGMERSWQDNVKDAFSGMFGGNN